MAYHFEKHLLIWAFCS